MLKIQDIVACYGKLEVLKGISMNIEDGEIVAVIGGNGSGKSTILNAIFGLAKVKSGNILFQGNNIKNIPPHQMPGKGICYVPQGRMTFSDLTVKENLEMGAFLRTDDMSPDLNYVYKLFPVLFEKKYELARNLSGGQQQMLAIGRALMLKPKLLLLDEPSLGLSPMNKKLILEKIVEINNSGTSIILVEQNARKALSIASRAYVIDNGKVSFCGKASEVEHDSKLREIYFGG